LPGHRLESYRRLAAQLGCLTHGHPQLRRAMAEPDEGPGPDGVLLLPGSATPTAAWPSFAHLARLLRQQGLPVWVCPDHLGRLPAGFADFPRLGHAPDLATIAAAGRSAGLVVGNDSGLTHLVVAARRGVGLSPKRVHGIALSTDPARTGAPGATWHLPPNPPDCAPCYRKRCARDPERPPCMALSPDALLPRLLRSFQEDPRTLPGGPPGIFG
jgi:ADP-heptose:LPS heptosyltransferase